MYQCSHHQFYPYSLVTWGTNWADMAPNSTFSDNSHNKKNSLKWIESMIFQLDTSDGCTNGCPGWSTHRFMFNFLMFLMMTSSNGNIFRVTGPLCEELTGPSEFPTQRPVTRRFDFSLICVWINGWVNNREAGDLRRHHGIIVKLAPLYLHCLVFVWWYEEPSQQESSYWSSSLMIFQPQHHKS